MRIAVAGAGALGGFFAAHLTRCGHSVALLARGESLAAIQRSGIAVEEGESEFTAMPAVVTTDPERIGPVEAVILTVKAWQVPAIAPSLKPLLTAGTRVLPLQNGTEAPLQLCAVLGDEIPLGGLIRIIVRKDSPNRIRNMGMVPTLMLGELKGGALAGAAPQLVEALRDTGTVVEVPADIQAEMWGKLALIAAFSGVCGVARCTIGEARSQPRTRQLLHRMLQEVAAVASAQKVALAPDIDARILKIIDGLPADGTASMQRDIAAGLPSELEAIIGAVVRLGEQKGIATPTADLIYASLLPQELRSRQRINA